jgi:hypothetical protein
MTQKQRWLYSLLTAGIITTFIIIFIYVLAFNPKLSDAWDNAFGGKFLFRDNPRMITEQYLPFLLLCSMPMTTLLLRFTLFGIDEIEKALEVKE